MSTYKTEYPYEDLQLIQECHALIGQNKPEEAQAKLREHLTNLPKGFTFDHHVEEKIYQFILGHHQESFQIIKDHPISQWFYVLGVSYLKMGDEGQAKESFEKSLAYNPTFTYAMNKLALIAMNQRDINLFFKYWAQAYVCSYTPTQYKDDFETLSLLFLARRDLSTHLSLLEVANSCEYDQRLMHRMQEVRDHFNLGMVTINKQSFEEVKEKMGLKLEASAPLLKLLKILEDKGQDATYYHSILETLEEMDQRLSIYW